MKTAIDQGTMWCIPPLDDLRFMRAVFVRHAFKPHAHDHYVIGIIEQGIQSFTHARQRHITTPGSVIVINPGEMHTGESVIKEGFVYRALYPTVALFQRIGQEFNAKPDLLPHFAGGVIHDPALFAGIQHLHHFSEHADSSLELETQWTHLFVELIRRHSTPKLSISRHKDATPEVMQVRDYLEAHFAEDVTLSQLAAIVHLSPFHLARMFQRQFGLPPHKYLESVRVRHAQSLLNQHMPIAEAAYSTGFSSQSHLNRTFKQCLGLTPGQFVQQRKIV